MRVSPCLALVLVSEAAAQTGSLAESRRAIDAAAKEIAGGTPAHRAKARTLLKSTLEWSRKSGDKTIEARASALTANTYAADNDPRGAIEWYGRSLAAAAAAGDEGQRVRALHNLAIQRWITGDAERSLAELRSLLPARQALGDKPGLGYTWLGIAVACYSLGDTAEALDAFRRALEIWTAAGDAANQAQARNSIGLMLDQLGDATAARREYEEALRLWRGTKSIAGEGMTLNNLCLWSIGRRDYRGATGYCEQALPLLEKAGDRRGHAYAWHNLASAHAGNGDHRRAVDLYQRSLAAKSEIGDRWGEAASLQAAGESMAALGDTRAGRANMERALRIRLELGDRAGQIQTLGELARIQSDAGELTAALDHIRRAVGHIETTRASLASQDRRASFLAGRRDYYELLASVLVRLGRHAEAIEAAESARGRQLLDRLSDTLAGLKRGADPALLERRASNQRRSNALAERLQRMDNAAAAERASVAADLDALLAE